MILAVALSPSLDRTLVVDQIRIGGISRPEQTVTVPGGKGFNLARAARTLGGAVTAFGVLGGPTGALLSSALRRTGLPLTEIAGSVDTRTCTSIADRSDGSLTEFYEAATVTDAEFAALATAVTAAARPGQWVALSGSLPPAVRVDRLPALIGALQSLGTRVALDTSGPALTAGVAARPALVKVNAAEAAEFLPSGKEPAALADLLHRRTGGLAVVTAGADGAWARAEESWHVGSPVRGPYPVGSGDCFLAGLLVGLEAGLSVPGALRQAAAVAGANAQQPGAAVLSLDAVRAVEQQLTRHRYSSDMPG